MLTPRLQAILNILPEVSSVLDVGTDHCLLPIAIKKRYPMMEVAASDVALGPLANAQKQLDLQQISDIALYHSNGLCNIPKSYECVMIAGMGAQTMMEILTASEAYVRNCKYLILQANTEVDDLRKWLLTNGYCIVDEDIIFDYKYYQILLVENGHQDANEEDVLFGPILRKRRSAVFVEYWENELQKQQTIKKRLPSHHIKHEELDKRIALIQENIKK